MINDVVRDLSIETVATRLNLRETDLTSIFSPKGALENFLFNIRLLRKIPIGLIKIFVLRKKPRQNEETVRAVYESDSQNIDRFLGDYGDFENRKVTFYLGNSLVRISKMREIKFSIEIIGDVIEDLKPMTVCEVGSGYGRNLLYLAGRFPHVEFKGVELAQRRVEISMQLREMDSYDTEFAKLYELRADNHDSWRRVEFQRGSAFDLPLEDNSADLIYTRAALEAMYSDIASALGEIRRVGVKYAVFYETFTDQNNIIQRMNMINANVFRLSRKEMESHGFMPLKHFSTLPRKRTASYSLLVTKIL